MVVMLDCIGMDGVRLCCRVYTCMMHMMCIVVAWDAWPKIEDMVNQERAVEATLAPAKL